MARAKAFVLLPLTGSGGHVIDQALAAHAGVLKERGVRRPAKTSDEMFRAAVELSRQHREWGYRRRDVEGAWAQICRRAHKASRKRLGSGSLLADRPTVVVGHRLLAEAAPVEIDLLLDGLAGLEVHAVVVADPSAHDRVAQVQDRWVAALRNLQRVHVLSADGPAGPERDRALWSAFGGLLGVRVDDLAVPEPACDRREARRLARRHLVEVSGTVAPAPVDARDAQPAVWPVGSPATDPAQWRALEVALGESLLEAARLRARVDQLEARQPAVRPRRRHAPVRLLDPAS